MIAMMSAKAEFRHKESWSRLENPFMHVDLNPTVVHG